MLIFLSMVFSFSEASVLIPTAHAHNTVPSANKKKQSPPVQQALRALQHNGRTFYRLLTHAIP